MILAGGGGETREGRLPINHEGSTKAHPRGEPFLTQHKENEYNKNI